MNTFKQLFQMGANKLATAPQEFGAVQKAAGFTQDEWELLTTDEGWTQAERMKLKTLISNAVSITLTTAGLPAVPLPGAYVAAVICHLVAPCNRLVAAAAAPESFDALSAVGIHTVSTKVITTQEQMYALVLYFSSDDYEALSSFKISEEIEEAVAHAISQENNN